MRSPKRRKSGLDSRPGSVSGDPRVLLGQAVNILDLAQKAGAEGIAIATQQPVEP
jgi:biopolymer transport protein ExbD